jgi:2-iminobutanoate/2-iminopropanoate deaminase
MRSFLILSSAVFLLVGCATTDRAKIIGDSAMTLERRNYANVPPPVGLYVHAVRSGGHLFVSGITAFGSPAENDGTAEQLDYVYSELAKIAANEGVSLNELAKVTIFVTDFGDIARLREVLAKHYQGRYPASSLIRVAGLFAPNLKVEVEAVLALRTED